MILTASGAAKRLLLRRCRSNSLGQADWKVAKEKDFSCKWIWKWPERPHSAPKGFMPHTRGAQAHEDPSVVMAAHFSTAHQLWETCD